MTHIRWVPRQNKLEIPKDKDEVNKRDIHECNGRTHDPDVMVDTPTPKETRKSETLVRTTPTTQTLTHVVKKTIYSGSDYFHGTVTRDGFLKLKQKSEAPE